MTGVAATLQHGPPSSQINHNRRQEALPASLKVFSPSNKGVLDELETKPQTGNFPEGT
jgi:hypothetical protein